MSDACRSRALSGRFSFGETLLDCISPGTRTSSSPGKRRENSWNSHHFAALEGVTRLPSTERVGSSLDCVANQPKSPALREIDGLPTFAQAACHVFVTKTPQNGRESVTLTSQTVTLLNRPQLWRVTKCYGM